MAEKPWDKIFLENGRFFKKPHPDMPQVLKTLQINKMHKVLDLGCGTGRHLVYLAQHNMQMYGIDNSPEALRQSREWLDQESLYANLELHEITNGLPYPDEFFDALISVQVINHGTLATIEKIIGEISRVVRPGGFIFITVAYKKHPGTNYREIEPNTFIPEDGKEKGLPHHMFTEEELKVLFKDFRITGITIDKKDHYCLTAFKKG